MSSIPTSTILIQFPDDGGGDPARGGGSTDATMASVLETLRHIQTNVGAINGNVRAILETLRRIAAGVGRGGGGGGGAGGGGGGAGGRAGGAGRGGGGPASTFSASILEYRNRMTRTAGLGIGDVASDPHRRLLSRYHDLTERASMSRQEMREALSLRRLEIFGETQRGNITAETAREIYRREREEQRAAMRQARIDQMGNMRAARNRMSGEMSERLRILRRQRDTGNPLAFNEHEQAIIGGHVSPSGLPGTAAYHASIRQLARPPAAPAAAPEAPAVNPLQAFMNGFNNIMRVVTMVGRILSVGTMVLNFIRGIYQKIQQITEYAKSSRRQLAAVDPVMAGMEARLTIERLRADISVARDPGVRAAMGQMTMYEQATIGAMVPLRKLGNRLSAGVGSFWEKTKLMNALFYGGIVEGNGTSVMQGLMLAAGRALAMTGSLGQALNLQIEAAVMAQLTANLRSSNGMFVDDLRSMTAGRFDLNRAYPRGGSSDSWWRSP